MDYLLHGIAWGAVQRMLIDAPGVEEKGKGGSSGKSGDDVEIALTDDNAAEIMNLINRMNR
ncbi:hypothetical protein E4T81_01665 [Barnesiella sp. WM24]|uniref:hypothetical protein n=1 Tax=Barnesiella sp. WM24 TaxID=2558278 RepID=UPI0010723374|nr:hypothetical protein [Barnesiella sp. WM24]TFU95261.1 hypothetical protein E4T81_01665 [Barnesiella sp. WM24]